VKKGHFEEFYDRKSTFIYYIHSYSMARESRRWRQISLSFRPKPGFIISEPWRWFSQLRLHMMKKMSST
jgi:hypothetical protein